MKSIYAASNLYEVDPSAESAQVVLEGLISGDREKEAAAAECVKGLKNRIAEPLVAFVESEGRPQSAVTVLEETRDLIIKDLDNTLDVKQAELLLEALGVVGDETSIARVKQDLDDNRLESSWRVAAASSLGQAAASDLVGRSQKNDIISTLSAVMMDEKQDDRVKIGAAIALCKLKQKQAVTFLLSELSRSGEAVGDDMAKKRDMTTLRVRAQEALTVSGDFVVADLMAKLRAGLEQKEPPPDEPRPEGWVGATTIWAAARTLGELGVADAVPHLGRYLLETREPVRDQEDPTMTVLEDGSIVGSDGTATTVELENWETPDQQEVDKLQQALEPFKHPPYVRWTAAIALGQIGGQDAERFLNEARASEEGFVERLDKNSTAPENRRDYYKRAPVIEGLLGRHQHVLFYVRRALEEQVAER
jgi:HEAT repeat protein